MNKISKEQLKIWLQKKEFKFVALALIIVCLYGFGFYIYTQATVTETTRTIAETLVTKKTSVKDYLNQSNSEYLVYFYSEKCSDCLAYVDSLKDYQAGEGALPLYTVEIDREDPGEVKEKFAVSSSVILVHVKENKEKMRYYGTPVITNLPHK